VVVAVLLVVVGPRPRSTALLPPRSYGKPEAGTAVDKLLMMGMRMPETCWAAFKRQAINLRNCCICLVDSFEVMLLFWNRVFPTVWIHPQVHHHQLMTISSNNLVEFKALNSRVVLRKESW
jgi:hypothetical protein